MILSEDVFGNRYFAMENVQLIKEKKAVLVPIKDWEKLQKELVRLRKQTAKDELLRDLNQALAGIKADSRLPPDRRRKRMTADEFLQKMQDAE